MHLGFYNIKSRYVAYGSLGVAIESPNVAVRVSSHTAPEVIARYCSEVLKEIQQD